MTSSRGSSRGTAGPDALAYETMIRSLEYQRDRAEKRAADAEARGYERGVREADAAIVAVARDRAMWPEAFAAVSGADQHWPAALMAAAMRVRALLDATAEEE